MLADLLPHVPAQSVPIDVPSNRCDVHNSIQDVLHYWLSLESIDPIISNRYRSR